VPERKVEFFAAEEFETFLVAFDEQWFRDLLVFTLHTGLRRSEVVNLKSKEHAMTDKKVWFITGAGRGLGVDIAQAALAAGHVVVATGRDSSKVAAAVGNHEHLVAITLDVTRPQDVQAAVEAAVAKFGRIDVLINNAGNFFAGFFEELSPDQVRNQIETLLFGPMNVTRAVLPVMRKQRSGLLVTISSTAGIAGQMFCTAYAAAKFGIEGWMESLTPEIAPFGIRTMLDEPGFFRTELLSDNSTTYAEPTIDDYAERTKEIVVAWKSMDGKQGGNPAKLAAAIVKLVTLEEPPNRFAAGADAVQALEAKANTLLAQVHAHRDLSTSLAYDEA
jgi:NAD(P)-dependent dehydrogenase (short-subunit alcohol dehydrogenase family)